MLERAAVVDVLDIIKEVASFHQLPQTLEDCMFEDPIAELVLLRMFASVPDDLSRTVRAALASYQAYQSTEANLNVRCL